VQVFHEPLQSSSIIDDARVEQIFGQVRLLYQLNSAFLECLQDGDDECVDDKQRLQCVFRAFNEYLPMMKVYGAHAAAFARAQSVLEVGAGHGWLCIIS
jgi:hypothetical protein